MIYLSLLAPAVAIVCVWIFTTLETTDKVGITTAISMVALVILTGIYAWQTRKMANEMREQRYDTVRPVIDIYRDPSDEDKLSEAFASTNGDASQGLSCVLENIGLGPAIDVYSFVQNPQSGKRQRHEFGTLAIGKKTYRMKLSLIYEDNPLALVAYYRDVYGRAFVSIREVSSGKERGWQIGPLQTHPVTED